MASNSMPAWARSPISRIRGWRAEEGRACIHVLDLETGQDRIFAGGLRNAVGHGVGADDRRVVDGRQRAGRSG